MVPADVLPAVETEEGPHWLTSALPHAGPEYLRLRDVTEVASPAGPTVAVVWQVTVPVDAARVGNTGVAGVSLVAQLTETLPGLSTGPVLCAAVLGTHRNVTERSGPARLTVTVQGSLAVPVLTARPGGADTAVLPSVALTALTLPGRHTHPVTQLAALLALRLVTEHPGPARLTLTLEPLGAGAVQTARQWDAVSAARARVAEVTLAVPGRQAVAVLGVTLGATHRHLAKVSYPASQALDLALTGADVPGLVPQAGSTAGLLLPAPTITRSRAGDHQGHQQAEQEEQHGGGGGGGD